MALRSKGIRQNVRCFLATGKGRNRALRLYVGAKRRGLRVKMVTGKGRVCVVARRKGKR